MIIKEVVNDIFCIELEDEQLEKNGSNWTISTFSVDLPILTQFLQEEDWKGTVWIDEEYLEFAEVNIKINKEFISITFKT